MALTPRWPPVISKLCKWGFWERVGVGFEDKKEDGAAYRKKEKNGVAVAYRKMQ